MTFKYEHTVLGFVHFRSSTPIETGTSLTLRPQLAADLEQVPDGMMLKQQAYVGRGYLEVCTATKGTSRDPGDDTFAGQEFVLNRTDTYYGDEINAENLIFARSCLALLIGYKKRIISE